MGSTGHVAHSGAWNMGKIVGPKAQVKLKDMGVPCVRCQRENWVRERAPFNLGIDSKHRADDGTRSMRRTKATPIDRRRKNLRAAQLLLGLSKLDSTVRCLGLEVDHALAIPEQTEI